MSRPTDSARPPAALVRAAAARPGYALGVAGLAVGAAVAGVEGACFGALLGFFAGKSLLSTLWAVGR
ncbi:hypothetical protein [Halostella litorea]|uniref:hypothetical protein n=1 Tax=Halostella litorea TaxID=2528831 RepID=UPI0010927AC9|nr:hypothetical protein [Halostella litorea]